MTYDTGSSMLNEIAEKRDAFNAKMHSRAAPVSKPSPVVFAEKQPTIARETPPPPPLQLTGSPLDSRLTFENFFVGYSNRLAWVEAQRAAFAKTPSYNPLYLHGDVGLGKTHLLQAIAHAAESRRVVYLTAERFMYGLLSSIKAQTAAAFTESLRDTDILVIDDVQFLLGKAMQYEFCHVLDALIESQKQIVIAADRPPGDFGSLEERVRSRLAGGLCIEVGGLDEALRVKILASRIADSKVVHQDFYVPAEVIAYVASVIQTNGRDLEGAVNRLIAHAALRSAEHHHYKAPGSVTMEMAEIAIRDLVRAPERKKIKIEAIQRLVAKNYNVNLDDMLSARRTASVVRPRQIAMYLSKVLTPRSLPEIGRRFGGKDHTTVLHAVRKITALAAEDAAVANEISVLREMLLA